MADPHYIKSVCATIFYFSHSLTSVVCHIMSPNEGSNQRNLKCEQEANLYTDTRRTICISTCVVCHSIFNHHNGPKEYLVNIGVACE